MSGRLYRAGGRRIREKIGPSKKLTESVLAKRRLELAENRFLDVHKVSRESFRSFAQKYFVIGGHNTYFSSKIPRRLEGLLMAGPICLLPYGRTSNPSS